MLDESTHKPVAKTPAFFNKFLDNSRGPDHTITVKKEGWVTVEKNVVAGGETIRLELSLTAAKTAN
jgi:hypothetical protein